MQHPASDEDGTGQWLHLHRCDVMEFPGPGGAVLGVNIPLTCIWLDYDVEANEYACRKYEKRPKVCKDYQCDRSKKSNKMMLGRDGLHISG
jgi:hypothetical protein